MAASAVRRIDLVSPALLLGLVLAVAVLAYNVRFLDTGGDVFPPEVDPYVPSGGALPPGLPGAGVQVLILAFIAGAVAISLVAGYIAWKRGIEEGGFRWELLGYALGLGSLFLLLTNWGSVVSILQALIRPISTGPPAEPGEPGSGLVPWATSDAIPIAAILFAAAFGLVLLLNFLLGASFRRRAPRPAWEPRRIAADAVRSALRTLEAGGEFRKAVLECYRGMCSLLERQGVGSQETKTAREIEREAFQALKLSPGSVGVLTGLFEEARYSTHEVGAAQRDRAVACLETVRLELEA